jgi:ATP-binding cassette subfamily B multidrug efflux pump
MTLSHRIVLFYHPTTTHRCGFISAPIGCAATQGAIVSDTFTPLPIRERFMKRLHRYWRLLGYLKPYRRQVVIAYGAVLANTGLLLIVPQLLQTAIDNGIAENRPDALVNAGLIIFAISLVRGVLGFAQRFYGEWLGFTASYDMRNAFYDKVQRLPFVFHDESQTGDLMSRATSDITEAERFIGFGLMDLLATLVLVAGVIIAMFAESWQLTLAAIAPLLLLTVLAFVYAARLRPMFTSIQEQMGVLSTVMQESMTGIRVVQAFVRSAFERKKFAGENEEWFERRYAVVRMWAFQWPFFNLLIATSVFALLFFGGPQAISGEVSVGQIFALISYVFLLNGPAQRIGFVANTAATAAASGQRVFDILDQPDGEADPPNALRLESVQGAVAFEHVSFSYLNNPNEILSDISFDAKPGEIVALMGLTGSGKTTLINLIPRFYHPTKGVVRVDGHDIQEVQVESLRRYIGLVLQDPFLFSSTIRENIAYGRPDAPLEEVMAAARTARAHEFILSFPKGYDTKVGERGVTLSGGQKQRLAIARAVLMNPRILVLDDSTSSVDTETEHLIQQALSELMQGRTTFIIAQRLLTLKNADQILVLNDGRIVQRGTHRTLLAEAGLYRDIYDLQLKDQETIAEIQQA